MTWLHRISSLLRNLFPQERAERDLDEEVRAHLRWWLIGTPLGEVRLLLQHGRRRFSGFVYFSDSSLSRTKTVFG
jgi:hypothetical protein